MEISQIALFLRYCSEVNFAISSHSLLSFGKVVSIKSLAGQLSICCEVVECKEGQYAIST